jgi:ribosome-associated protein
LPDLFISPQITIPDEQLEWSFARSSGPGGQNVNKVNSKATLRWLPPENVMSGAAFSRFRKLADRYFTTEGEIVIQSQEFRDQAKNMESCREKLRHLMLAALTTPKRRVPTKPSKSSKRRRMDDKRKQSDKKKFRGSSDLG